MSDLVKYLRINAPGQRSLKCPRILQLKPMPFCVSLAKTDLVANNGLISTKLWLKYTSPTKLIYIFTFFFLFFLIEKKNFRHQRILCTLRKYKNQQNKRRKKLSDWLVAFNLLWFFFLNKENAKNSTFAKNIKGRSITSSGFVCSLRKTGSQMIRQRKCTLNNI